MVKFEEETLSSLRFFFKQNSCDVSVKSYGFSLLTGYNRFQGESCTYKDIKRTLLRINRPQPRILLPNTFNGIFERIQIIVRTSHAEDSGEKALHAVWICSA